MMVAPIPIHDAPRLSGRVRLRLAFRGKFVLQVESLLDYRGPWPRPDEPIGPVQYTRAYWSDATFADLQEFQRRGWSALASSAEGPCS